MDTQINIWVVLAILSIHWFADFVLQTDKQAKGKSKNMDDLIAHTTIYSIVFMVGICFLWGNGHSTYFYVTNSILFGIITYAIHTVQDYFTSRLNSKLWVAGKVHLFFVSVGFDQLLHFAQLLLTYQLLK